jgi:hypothetical protein
MKTHLTILTFAVTISAMPLRAQDDDTVFPPTPIPPERYEIMMQRSPFVLPTAEIHTEVTTTWASDFQIVSLLKVENDYVVFAKKISTDERIRIRREDNAQGIRLVEIQMSSDPREVSAVLEMGGVEGTIQYDPEILSGLPTPMATGNPALISE